MSTLAVEGLTVAYDTPAGPVVGLQPTTFGADEGEVLLVGGPSGSGKTTLLSSLGGILRPTGGRVIVDGTEISALRGRVLTTFRRRTIGFVFQDFNLVASLDATENVCVPLWADRRRDARSRAEELLDRLGLADRRHHRPDQLSGGQQQRVAIARALALDPSVLIADEPTANLDVESAERVIALLLEETAGGRVVVMATHDSRLKAIADRVVDLSRGRSTGVGTTTIDLRPGQVLFAQGDPADVVYLVQRGAIDLVVTEPDGAKRNLRRCYPGEHFGELGPLLGAPRSATARAAVRTTLVASSFAEFRAGRTPSRAAAEPDLAGSAGC